MSSTEVRPAPLSLGALPLCCLTSLEAVWILDVASLNGGIFLVTLRYADVAQDGTCGVKIRVVHRASGIITKNQFNWRIIADADSQA